MIKSSIIVGDGKDYFSVNKSSSEENAAAIAVEEKGDTTEKAGDVSSTAVASPNTTEATSLAQGSTSDRVLVDTIIETVFLHIVRLQSHSHI